MEARSFGIPQDDKSRTPPVYISRGTTLLPDFRRTHQIGSCCYTGGMSSAPHILPNLPKTSATQQRQTAPYEPVCAIFRRYLHEQKLKFTPERAMMLDAVLRKEGLFEPEGLVEDLKKLGHR